MGAGGAVAVWRQDDGTDLRIYATHRPASGGFGAPRALSEPGQDADRPRVAMDEAGNAIATWERSDGENLRTQSAIGVAPGVAPPPPPPPPPPAPAAAAAAPWRRRCDRDPAGRSLQTRQRSGARGGRRRAGGAPGVGPAGGRQHRGAGCSTAGCSAACASGRGLSSSFTVKVRAFGPNGAGQQFARTFRAPRALAAASALGRVSVLTRGDVDRVTRALAGRPAVSAVGDAERLLGRPGSCSTPTSVQSGQARPRGLLRSRGRARRHPRA